MSTHAYDIVVLGAGMAGLAATRKLATAGQHVAIVDVRPYGGTCALRGCDPKKVLVGAADLVDATRRLHGSAHFTSPTHVRVDGTDLTADHFLVATGAQRRPLGIPGEDLLATSTDNELGGSRDTIVDIIDLASGGSAVDWNPR